MERSQGQTETWNWTHWSKWELFTLKPTRIKEGDWGGWLSEGGHAEFKPQLNSLRVGKSFHPKPGNGALGYSDCRPQAHGAASEACSPSGTWRHITVFQRKERGKSLDTSKHGCCRDWGCDMSVTMMNSWPEIIQMQLQPEPASKCFGSTSCLPKQRASSKTSPGGWIYREAACS